MTQARAEADQLPDLTERAFAYAQKVFPFLDKIREHIDKLELTVDDSLWTLPKYRELLFLL